MDRREKSLESDVWNNLSKLGIDSINQLNDLSLELRDIQYSYDDDYFDHIISEETVNKVRDTIEVLFGGGITFEDIYGSGKTYQEYLDMFDEVCELDRCCSEYFENRIYWGDETDTVIYDQMLEHWNRPAIQEILNNIYKHKELFRSLKEAVEILDEANYDLSKTGAATSATPTTTFTGNNTATTYGSNYMIWDDRTNPEYITADNELNQAEKDKILQKIKQDNSIKNVRGYVYIITSPDTDKLGYIKIGYSDNPEQRVKQLNRSNQAGDSVSIPEFEIYAIFPVSKRLYDKDIHKFIELVDKNLRRHPDREFFYYTKEEAFDMLDQLAYLSGGSIGRGVKYSDINGSIPPIEDPIVDSPKPKELTVKADSKSARQSRSKGKKILTQEDQERVNRNMEIVKQIYDYLRDNTNLPIRDPLDRYSNVSFLTWVHIIDGIKLRFRRKGDGIGISINGDARLMDDAEKARFDNIVRKAFPDINIGTGMKVRDATIEAPIANPDKLSDSELKYIADIHQKMYSTIHDNKLKVYAHPTEQ